MSLKDKYRTQKFIAAKRGIEWHFTFESWLAWWGDDITLRGRNSNQLCMARNGDTGPYHPNNVHKATIKENSIEVVKKTKPIKTPLGYFNSKKDAAIAHNICSPSLSYRLKMNPTEYYFIEKEKV